MWGTIVGLLGTGLSLYGSKQQSDAQEEYGEKSAAEAKQVAKHNAEISRRDAEVMLEGAREEEFKTGVELFNSTRKMNNYISTLRSSAAKSGIAVGTGTPLDIEVYSRENMVADLEMIKYEGKKAAEKKRDLAGRYYLLAEYGLRDAAAYASNILEAAKDESNATLLTGMGKTAMNFYSVAESAGWLSE